MIYGVVVEMKNGGTEFLAVSSTAGFDDAANAAYEIFDTIEVESVEVMNFEVMLGLQYDGIAILSTR